MKYNLSGDSIPNMSIEMTLFEKIRMKIIRFVSGAQKETWMKYRYA